MPEQNGVDGEYAEHEYILDEEQQDEELNSFYPRHIFGPDRLFVCSFPFLVAFTVKLTVKPSRKPRQKYLIQKSAADRTC